jgi:hypothetical protein
MIVADALRGGIKSRHPIGERSDGGDVVKSKPSD